jgi:hypothetical protein
LLAARSISARCESIIALGVALAVTVTVPLTARAADTPAVPLAIAVQNYAGLSVEETSDVQTMVSRIFAGVLAIEWMPDAPLTIVLLPEDMTSHVSGAPEVLGVTPRTRAGHACRTFLFVDRVRDKSRDWRVPFGDLLGYVAAHEMGHMLLPSNSHATLGVMRTRFDAPKGPIGTGEYCFFTADQERLIRERAAMLVANKKLPR